MNPVEVILCHPTLRVKPFFYPDRYNNFILLRFNGKGPINPYYVKPEYPRLPPHSLNLFHNPALS